MSSSSPSEERSSSLQGNLPQLSSSSGLPMESLILGPPHLSSQSGEGGSLILLTSPPVPPESVSSASKVPSSSSVPHKRKNTSFKITNILPSRPPSNDPEESGEDDPDDSHTEELSEESPKRLLASSLRRNSFDAAASAAAACVAAGGTKEAAVFILSSSGLPASAMSVLTEALPVFAKNAKWVSSVLNVSQAGGIPPDARQGPRDRFKVVRMETSAPLKRGRWTCIDYIDKRSIAPSPYATVNAAVAVPSSGLTSTEKNELNHDNGDGNEEGGVSSTSAGVVPSAAAANSVHIPSSSLGGVESVRLSSNPTTPSLVQSPSTGGMGPPSSSTSSSQAMLQQLYTKGGPQQVIQFAAAPNTPASVLKQANHHQPASLLMPQNTTPNLVSTSSSNTPGGPVPSPQISSHQLLLGEGHPPLSSYITPINFAGLIPNSSAVNSIPPSRAETDILHQVCSFYPSHFDHPIDNEHLVERLEEISTQQNAPNSVEEDIDNSASGTNQGAIDNRIEQAMDLVKSHLMNAVRSEVEELKERIVKLEDVISHLQTENDFLKANVTQEVLTQLPPPTAHHQILQQQGPNAPVSAAPAGSISPIASPLILSSQQQQQPL